MVQKPLKKIPFLFVWLAIAKNLPKYAIWQGGAVIKTTVTLSVLKIKIFAGHHENRRKKLYNMSSNEVFKMTFFCALVSKSKHGSESIQKTAKKAEKWPK